MAIMVILGEVRSAWTEPTAATLKAVFFIHLLFVTWSSSADWLPIASVQYNTLFFACLLWGIHTKLQSSEPVKVALGINLLSVILDIWTMIVIRSHHGGSRYDFGRAFSIILLLARPITSFALYRYIKNFVPVEPLAAPSAPAAPAVPAAPAPGPAPSAISRKDADYIHNHMSPAGPAVITVSTESGNQAAPPLPLQPPQPPPPPYEFTAMAPGVMQAYLQQNKF